MIDRTKLAEAATTADLRTEEIGIEAWCAEQRIEVDGLMYLSQQRAMRAAMLFIDGYPPEQLQAMQATGQPMTVKLSKEATAMIPALAACIMDGIAIGRTVKED